MKNEEMSKSHLSDCRMASTETLQYYQLEFQTLCINHVEEE